MRIPELEQYQPIRHGELKLIAATFTPWLVLAGLWQVPIIGGYLVLGGLSFAVVLIYAMLRKDRQAKVTLVREWLDKLSRDNVWGTELLCCWDGVSFKLSFARAWTRQREKLAIAIPLGGWIRRARVIQERDLEGWMVRKYWIDFTKRTVTVQLSDGRREATLSSPQRAVQYLLHAPTGEANANDVLEALLRENLELKHELGSLDVQVDKLQGRLALTPLAAQ